MAGIGGGCALWVPIATIQKAQQEGTTGWWTWGAITLIEIVCLPLAVLGIWGAVNLWRTERPRTVMYDQTGFLVEEKDQTPWRARWDEIESIKQRWNGQDIHTPHGILMATTTMEPYRIFRRNLEANLPENIKKARETISGDSSIYSYVFPGFKAVLFIPIGLGLAMPLVRLLQNYLGLEVRQNYKPVDIAMGYSVCGALILLGLWGFWRMYASRIEVSESGITQVGLNGNTHLRWIDVEKGRITGSELLSWYELVGTGKRVRWWMGLPGAARLNEEITRRLPDIPLDWKL